MKKHRMWEEAARKGATFQRLLTDANCRYIGNIRGRGLMFGVELVNPGALERGLPRPWGELCAESQAECFKRGLIIERGGRQGAVLRPLPPLIVSEEEIK